MSTFRVDSIDLSAVVAMFRDPNGNPNHIYVASLLDSDEFRKRFSVDYTHDYARCVPLGFDDYNRDEKFWLGGVVIGNAGGPMAIIRASDESHAIDLLADDFKCCHLSAEQVQELENEGHGEMVHWTDTGTAYDAENMHLRQVQLIRIDME